MYNDWMDLDADSLERVLSDMKVGVMNLSAAEQQELRTQTEDKVEESFGELEGIEREEWNDEIRAANNVSPDEEGGGN
jgi:hypothetical protein